jgi:serine/threonine protein kinase
MSNLIGHSLGRYHILEQLGEGGMATVYKAHDTRLERNVAIKVIRNDLFGAAVLERMLKRFEREARALAKLSHPNIVKVLDYGEYEGAPYFVMEYLPGGTLKEKLGGRRVAWQDALRLLIPIAQALAYAHENKIIHRDIKPSNILITQSGEPMLSDFGIARILEDDTTTELTASGAGIGTPEYMAPEQGMGQSDERADIYALGIVLYQMVTGHVPYRADTPMAILLKKNQEPLPRPRQFVPSLPESVENLLVKALARDPVNRYQTTREVVATFDRLLRGETIVAPPPPPPPPRPAPNRNWMWLAVGAGALFLLAACLIVGVVLGSNLLGGRDASPQAPPTSFVPDPLPGRATEAPTMPPNVYPSPVPPSPVPPSPIPTDVPPTQAPALSDPADFARWYFNSVWAERDYQYLWDTCQTTSFQNHSSNGDYSEFVKWWSSVQQVDVLSVEVVSNDGRYATIRVSLIFHLANGRTLSAQTYEYDLTYNRQSGLWMFDYRQ